MIEQSIESVIVIDDNHGEVETLIKLLESKDIWTRYYHPQQLLEAQTQLRNRKLIFLDLYWEDSQKLEIQISLIRKVFKSSLGKGFGSFGIVLWTKHSDEIAEFKKRIQNDSNLYDLPLFIISLDKSTYLRTGNYETIFDDINRSIQESTAARFFVEWNKSVNKGKDTAICTIFSLINDYEKQDQNLEFILFQLAKNLTGIPVEIAESYSFDNDALKAFSDLLYYEVVNSSDGSTKIFQNIENIHYKWVSAQAENYEYRSSQEIKKDAHSLSKAEKKDAKNVESINSIEKELKGIYSKLNSRLLIDYNNINQDVVMPGNVYFIAGESNLNIEDRPEASTPILIEITPPCDFAQKKMKKPRCISGFLIPFDSGGSLYDKECYYKELHPIELTGFDMPQRIIFDFRYLGILEESELKNPDKYKLMFRTKDKLFADILQKFSAHTARLGLAIIK